MGIKVSNIVILNVYNPPSNHIDKQVLNYINKFPNVIMCGDFNAHHRLWDVGTPNQNGYILADFIENNEYTILNLTKPTHVTLNKELKTSLIDLTITSSSISHKCCVNVTNSFLGSDHCVIDIKINVIAQASKRLPRWAFNRADWKGFHQLCDSEINQGLISNSIHDFYRNLISTIFDIATRTIPITKMNDKISVPWWNKSCEVAVKNKKHAFNRMMRTRDPQDIIVFKRARAKAKVVLNDAQKATWQNYCSTLSTTTKLGQVWTTINKFKRQQTDRYIPTLHQNGITGTNDLHKANMLANQFQAASCNENYPYEFQKNSAYISYQLAKKLAEQEYQNMEFNAPFSYEELNDALKKCRNSAVGSDFISSEMLKHMPSLACAGVLEFKPRAGQILYYAALQTVRHCFNIYASMLVYVALALCRGDEHRKLVTRFGILRRIY